MNCKLFLQNLRQPRKETQFQMSSQTLSSISGQSQIVDTLNLKMETKPGFILESKVLKCNCYDRHSTLKYVKFAGGPPFSSVKLNIMNMNRQQKMFSEGMSPVYKVVPGRPHWERIHDKPIFTVK